MKQKILSYAFIFTVLLVIYQYVNTNRLHADTTAKIEELSERNKALKNDIAAYKDSTEVLIDENLDLSYFSLANNGEAQEYFEDLNFENDIAQIVSDAIYDQNKVDKDNPLVPFDGLEGVFIIDKVKVINHKWVLCSFSDGAYWGEMLLRYEFDKNRNLVFERLAEVLYQKYTG